MSVVFTPKTFSRFRAMGKSDWLVWITCLLEFWCGLRGSRVKYKLSIDRGRKVSSRTKKKKGLMSRMMRGEKAEVWGGRNNRWPAPRFSRVGREIQE